MLQDILDKKTSHNGGNYYIFGAPYKKSSRCAYWDDLLEIFDQDLTKCQDYATKVNDRIINKARGMISFNGILMAVTIFTIPGLPVLGKIVFLSLVSSTILNLFAMIILWRERPAVAVSKPSAAKVDGNAEKEMLNEKAYSTFSHACSRATAINISIFLSLISSLLLSVQVIFFSKF